MDNKYTTVQDEDLGYALDDIHAPRQSPPWPSSRRNPKDGTTYETIPTGAIDEFYEIDEDKKSLQSTEVLSVVQSRNLLPSVDIGSTTKLQCLFAIVLGIACFLVCIICSIRFWVTPVRREYGLPVVLLPEGLPGEAMSFIANIILTQCLEGLAYVHSISLRWALLKEDRLVFNTNIRLLTSSRHSRPNSWYINSTSAVLLIICYGTTSSLVIPEVDSDSGIYSNTYVNLLALLALGLALFGQTLLAIWCYYNNLRDIPSWSSNPLNTTVTMLNQQLVYHREGRCINSVQIPDTSKRRPMLPRTQQPSQWQASTAAKHANIFTWILVGFSFIWFLTILLVARTNMLGAINTVRSMSGNPLTNASWHFSFAWSPSANPIVHSITDTTYFNAVFFSLDPAETTGSDPSMSFVAPLLIGLLFVCIIQGLQTLGLHCAELIINLSRDEDVWRALDAQRRSSAKNHVLAAQPFLAALVSWKSNMLLIFKSLLHWLLGQSMQPSFDIRGAVWFNMIYTRLFVYVICATVFATVITFLTFKKPKGPQPVTYGHIQTIADVIDDWTLDEDGQFWWGDKGCREGVRHAGMSSQRKDLGPIQMDALYAGES